MKVNLIECWELTKLWYLAKKEGQPFGLLPLELFRYIYDIYCDLTINFRCWECKRDVIELDEDNRFRCKNKKCYRKHTGEMYKCTICGSIGVPDSGVYYACFEGNKHSKEEHIHENFNEFCQYCYFYVSPCRKYQNGPYESDSFSSEDDSISQTTKKQKKINN